MKCTYFKEGTQYTEDIYIVGCHMLTSEIVVSFAFITYRFHCIDMPLLFYLSRMYFYHIFFTFFLLTLLFRIGCDSKIWEQWRIPKSGLESIPLKNNLFSLNCQIFFFPFLTSTPLSSTLDLLSQLYQIKLIS